MKTYAIRWAALVSFAVTLAACGGGGGGGEIATIAAPTTTPVIATPTPLPQTLVRAALPTLVQDIEPAGARIDLRSRNYFPLGDGDTLTYDKTRGSTVIAGAVKRTTSVFASLDPVVVEVDEGVSTSYSYRRTANGILAIDPLGSDAPPAVRTLVGNVLEYPEPFFAIGAVRTTVRQGDFGADLDGDGIQESFRLEIKQSLVGLETLPLPVGTAEMAHFTTISTLTISPSRQSSEVSTVVTTENSWFAPGIGLARANYVSTRPDGTVEEPFYSTAIASGRVGGIALFPPISSTVKLALQHNALVFDAARNRYYASIPSSVVGQGDTIATIDPTTGATTYSAPVGSEPSALAISGDGKALFVGLNGSSDVVKLRLPDMAELSRTRLPPAVFSDLKITAESIAASPVDPDVVAVSMYGQAPIYTFSSSGHMGVVLIRSGAIQTRKTQVGGLGASNVIAFDPDGQFIYGQNMETSEFGLRRIEVLGDGLIERAVLKNAVQTFGINSIDVLTQGVVLESAIYQRSDLARLGQRPGLRGCRAHNVANRLVCFGGSVFPDDQLAVVNATTFAILATPSYRNLFTASPRKIVPGPVGQVALQFGGTYKFDPSSTIWLFNHVDLK